MLGLFYIFVLSLEIVISGKFTPEHRTILSITFLLSCFSVKKTASGFRITYLVLGGGGRKVLGRIIHNATEMWIENLKSVTGNCPQVINIPSLSVGRLCCTPSSVFWYFFEIDKMAFPRLLDVSFSQIPWFKPKKEKKRTHTPIMMYNKIEKVNHVHRSLWILFSNYTYLHDNVVCHCHGM